MMDLIVKGVFLRRERKKEVDEIGIEEEGGEVRWKSMIYI
jgi:hypothetical protein